MSRPILYVFPMSCVSQSTLIVTKLIGLDVEVRVPDPGKNNYYEDIQKLNPRHCAPFLIDGDLHLWESHAIIPYLIDKYAKDDSLYPRDLALRARINALLHFDNALLYGRVRDMGGPLWMKLRKDVSEESKKAAHDALKDFEILIGDGPWLFGEKLTIADICCVVNVQAMEAYIGETTSYAKLTKWKKHCEKNLPGYEEIIGTGFKEYVKTLKQMMS